MPLWTTYRQSRAPCLPLQWNEPTSAFSERRLHSPGITPESKNKMPESAISSSRPRVFSGMRPTGKLHLGNYMGALANWVKLQDQYECYFFIADWHALTTDYADPSQIAPNTLDVLLDYLAAGLDPARSVLFLQSRVLAARRAEPAAGHDYAGRLAGARAQLQGAAEEPGQQGSVELRVSGLPGADGLRHSDLPAADSCPWATTRPPTWS